MVGGMVVLRDFRIDDVAAALTLVGDDEVTRSLSFDSRGHRPDNTASIALTKRLGFTYQGRPPPRLGQRGMARQSPLLRTRRRVGWNRVVAALRRRRGG